MSMILSKELQEKINSMPEYSYGVTKIKVLLKNGTLFHNIYVSWGYEIIKFENSDIIPFKVEDIQDVENDL